ncbi:AzlD domain-containing protein [Leptolyngbya cf. ectocarpi LEGE 11479]|uniref:AzlD domain-containing protein n=1 Tax=Leptolyngbya cf. ectocarpi LEGE 11479 TaxID=1828722 RepID=A0A928ZT66_LEPEC|nr:AzlD domain-containing protein [Leptolyngbya ectocarpi]MBE9066521.1 AzlD domain-containing protein [Leptolyngbya cf. ectocarpi LEGE 11479]
MTNEVMLLGGMMLVTFGVRYPLLAMSDRITLPPRLMQALNYVPPAVLTAIIVPAALLENNSLWLTPDNPRLVGALAALGIGLWKKNLLLTILVGMGVFLLWQSLMA